MSDIKAMIESMSAEDIVSLMANINRNNIRKVDTSRRARRLAMTDLYFSAEPKPHHLINDRPMSPEEYSGHRQGVWEQIMSGVEL